MVTMTSEVDKTQTTITMAIKLSTSPTHQHQHNHSTTNNPSDTIMPLEEAITAVDTDNIVVNTNGLKEFLKVEGEDKEQEKMTSAGDSSTKTIELKTELNPNVTTKTVITAEISCNLQMTTSTTTSTTSNNTVNTNNTNAANSTQNSIGPIRATTSLQASAETKSCCHQKAPRHSHFTTPPTNHHNKNEDAPNILVYKKVNSSISHVFHYLHLFTFFF